MKKVRKVIKALKKIPTHQEDIHTPYIRPPKRVVLTPKYTVEKLLQLADQKKKDAVKDIAVKAIRTMDLPKTSRLFDRDNTLVYRVQTYSKHNKHLHNVTIFCVEGHFGLDSKVLVDCSCSSHIFQCEYNLARRGNALMWRCNGEAPLYNLKTQICKHTHQAMRTMLRRQKTDQLPVRSRQRPKLSFARGT